MFKSRHQSLDSDSDLAVESFGLVSVHLRSVEEVLILLRLLQCRERHWCLNRRFGSERRRILEGTVQVRLHIISLASKLEDLRLNLEESLVILWIGPLGCL